MVLKLSHIVSLWFRKYETTQYFLNALYTKTRLSEGLPASWYETTYVSFKIRYEKC